MSSYYGLQNDKPPNMGDIMDYNNDKWLWQMTIDYNSDNDKTNWQGHLNAGPNQTIIFHP